MVGIGSGGGRGDGVSCLLEVPEACSCQVNVLQCTFEGVEVVGDKYIRRKYVPLGHCSWKEAVFVVVVGGEYLSVFVWIFVCICVGGWNLFGCVRV